MTEQDIKNQEALLKLVRDNVGLDKPSYELFEKQVRSPFIDECFSANMGDDFRARWEIDTTSNPAFIETIKQTDKGYQYFKRCFYRISQIVSYNDYQNNCILVGKNSLKLKKFIQNKYMEDKYMFIQDATTCTNNYDFYSSLKVRELSNNIPAITEKDIEEYIIKSFEKIGTVKRPNKSKLTLVLSLNIADWMMCSTAENWSSCLSLTHGGYFPGLFCLPGDFSRALIYVTDGSKKSFAGLTVDSFLSRSWVILGKNLKKYLVRFYPVDFVSLEMIKSITKDSSYTSSSEARNNIESKNDYKIINFEKKCSLTPYSDRTNYTVDSNGKVTQHISSGGSGVTVFAGRKNQINHSGYSIFGDILGSKSFKFFFENNKKMSNYINYSEPVCSACGKDEELVNINGTLYCKECAEKLFTKCNGCGNYYRKEEVRSIKDKYYCSRCYKLHEEVTCTCCGNIFKRKDTGILHDKVICNDCLKTKVRKCLGCKEIYAESDYTKYHDISKKNSKNLTLKYRCPSCSKALERETTFKACKNCGENYNKALIDENGVCVRCNGTYVD